MKRTVLAKNIVSNISSAMMVALFALPVLSFTEKPAASSKTSTPDHSITIIINKQSVKKNIDVEMLTNASLHQLLIKAGPQQNKIYHFFLFDIDGKLKAQANIRSNEKAAFVNIAKGNYFFEIFNDDERIETGQLKVK